MPRLALAALLLALAAGEIMHLTNDQSLARYDPKQQLFIKVDDVEDRVDGAYSLRRAAYCNAIPHTAAEGDFPAPEGTGACTLRAALELARTARNETAITILLRPGRFILEAPLPLLSGTVQFLGSKGRLRDTETAVDRARQASAGGNHYRVEENCDAEELRIKMLEGDDLDYEYVDHKGGPGQTSPIGTVFDGNKTFQILRTTPGSSVHIQSVRFEHGRAAGNGREGVEPVDARDWMGGAILSQGRLVLTNTVLRDNAAVYGGSLYTEGVVEVQQTEVDYNQASVCGGALYAASGGKVNFFTTNLAHNKDNCKRRTIANENPAAQPQYLPGSKEGPARLPGGQPGDSVQPGGKPRPVDASGAVAEGPPLTASVEFSARDAPSKNLLPRKPSGPPPAGTPGHMKGGQAASVPKEVQEAARKRREAKEKERAGRRLNQDTGNMQYSSADIHIATPEARVTINGGNIGMNDIHIAGSHKTVTVGGREIPQAKLEEAIRGAQRVKPGDIKIGDNVLPKEKLDAALKAAREGKH